MQFKPRSLVGDVVGDLEVVDDLVLGDFEDEARPVLRLRPLLAQDCAIGSLTKRRDRHVDRELHRHAVRGAVLPVAQRRDDDALGERQQVALAGAGQEGAGADHAAVRMARAHQRLGADQPHGREIDLGLVPQLEPVVPQHVAKRDLAVARSGSAPLARTAAQRLQHGYPRLSRGVHRPMAPDRFMRRPTIRSSVRPATQNMLCKGNVYELRKRLLQARARMRQGCAIAEHADECRRRVRGR